MGDPKQDRGPEGVRRASDMNHRASLAKLRRQINARAVRQARRFDEALLRLRPRK